MSKKFDIVIGNPPYQEEATGSATHQMPIYHRFMEAAYEIGHKAVLITPARFLFNAGYTPKAWNQQMLNDPRLVVSHYAPNSDKLFPGTDIKAGVAVTYWDEARNGDPIGTFTRYPMLNSILYKVTASQPQPLSPLITSSRSYRYTATMHEHHPDAAATMSVGEQFKINTRTFELLPFIYHEDRPSDSEHYVRVLGLIKNKRLIKWIRAAFVVGPANFDQYKVVLAKANGTGAFGETLATPIVVGPGVAITQSFITVGGFDHEVEAEACLTYIKTKFARTLLGVLKVTQDNPAKVWKHVPVQDFSPSSDIDWSKTVPEIDQQLYAKYGLDTDEIAFIEDNVKPME
ncbi:Eco57I restriction-modification methylase domain-containing protein [Corynebacterium dentalis]|uniref:Eco57I restriction-modification methylase domain-containing protein n=1 Tax=Corynebacterium dentalis TaxID=2014528 RepID=UPI00370D18C5